MRNSWIVLLLCFFISPLSAEIQQVQIKWTAGLCGSDCIKNLQKEFAKIPGVQETSFGNSQVVLKWKKGFPFAFESINYATRMVGIRLQDIRVRVRGKISNDADLFFLTSEGDGTVLQLLGPTTPERSGYTETRNIETHGFNRAAQARLLEARDTAALIVVEGPLFEPFQTPNLRLITETTRYPKKEEPPIPPPTNVPEGQIPSSKPIVPPASLNRP